MRTGRPKLKGLSEKEKTLKRIEKEISNISKLFKSYSEGEYFRLVSVGKKNSDNGDPFKDFIPCMAYQLDCLEKELGALQGNKE